MRSCKRLIILFFILCISLLLIKPAYLLGGSIVDEVKISELDSISQLSHLEKTPNTNNIKSTYVKSNPRQYSYTASANSGYGQASIAGNFINIAGKNLSIVNVDSTTVDAGNHVNRYGDRFYYGHNSSAVFGNLHTLGNGSTFSIIENGTQHNYRVARMVIFEKNTSTGRLQLNGAGNYMYNVSKAKHDGVQYSISIMTCYGTSYGNGDASHRFVIFANEY